MIIFNADDFGLTDADTQRILEVAGNGVIKSTTVAVTSVSDADLVTLRDSGLSAGLHVNLIEGRPLTPCGSILNGRGEFLPKRKLLRKIVSGAVDWRQVCAEIQAQIQRLQDFGVKISHVDSHQNTHFIPPVLSSVIKAMKACRMGRIRGFRPECYWFEKRSQIRCLVKSIASSVPSLMARRQGVITSDRIISPAPGLGIGDMSVEGAISLWERIIGDKYRPSLVYEVPCHLFLSDMEYQLYGAEEFRRMLDRHRVEIGTYDAIK